MKQATLFLSLFVIAYSLNAKSSPSVNVPSSYVDSLLIKESSMQLMLKGLLEAAEIDEELELKEADVLNIEARIFHRKKYILYNPVFITRINQIAKSDWSVIALLAHEIGHHVKRHTSRKGGSRPKLELQADEFAGFLLNKMGATLQQSQQVIYFIASTKPSRTHPSRKERLAAIKKGWNEAANSSSIASS